MTSRHFLKTYHHRGKSISQLTCLSVTEKIKSESKSHDYRALFPIVLLHRFLWLAITRQIIFYQ